MKRTDGEWRTVAQHVRQSVNEVAEQPRPLCLPGEEQACGQDARGHVLLWSADLKAVAQRLIEDSAVCEAEFAYYAERYFRDKLAALHDTRT